MDNFKGQGSEEDSSPLSDSSFPNSFLFKFIFDEKENSTLSQKPERSEYKIRVETNLKEPVPTSLHAYLKCSLIRKEN
jgi:hypothetical protein